MSLSELRAVIDGVDAEIVCLLGKRLRLAQQAGKIKHANGKPYYDPTREQEVLSHVATLAARAQLPADDVATIFRHIIAMCRAMQQQKEG